MILEIIRHKGYKCYEGKQSGEGYFRLCFSVFFLISFLLSLSLYKYTITDNNSKQHTSSLLMFIQKNHNLSVALNISLASVVLLGFFWRFFFFLSNIISFHKNYPMTFRKVDISYFIFFSLCMNIHQFFFKKIPMLESTFFLLC